MDTILKLYQKENFDKLQTEVNKLSIKELKNLIKEETLLKEIFGEIFKGILVGLEDKSQIATIVSHVIGVYLESLNSNKFSQNDALIRVLCEEIVNLKPDDYSHTLSTMLSFITNNMNNKKWSWLILFTKALQIHIQYPKLDGDISLEAKNGIEFKQKVIEKMCCCDWKGSFVLEITKNLRGVPLTSEEENCFFMKLYDQFTVVPLSQLPYFINELFCLAENYKKRTEQVLNKTIQLFEDKEKSASQVSSQVILNDADKLSCQSKLLVCMKNTIRYSPNISKALINLLKAAKEGMLKEQLTPLHVAFCLILADTSRYKEEIQNGLRQVIIKYYKTKRQLIKNAWLKCCSQATVNLEKSLFQVVENTKYKEWTTVQNQLIELCFIVLSHYSTKTNPFLKQDLPRELKKCASPDQDACDLSIKILASIFKTTDEAQRHIQNYVLMQIHMSKESPAHSYISILKAMVKVYPQFLNKSYNELRSTIEDLPKMHSSNAIKFVSSLMPFVRSNQNFRDALILVLRKSINSKSLTPQLTALYGFLNLLRSFPLDTKVSFSQVASQSSQSIFSAASQYSSDFFSPGSQSRQKVSNEFFCLEILQVMRRCLQQKIEIRREFYSGICWVTSKNKPLLTTVTETLLQQFKTYYDPQNDKTSLNILSCINVEGKASLKEPLPVLMSSLSICLRQLKQEPDDSNDCGGGVQFTTNKITNYFIELIEKFKSCEVENFGLEKSKDCTSTKQVILLSLVIGIYQTLLEFNFMQNCINETSCENQKTLAKNWKIYYDMLKNIKNCKVVTSSLSWQISCYSLFYISVALDRTFYTIPKEYEDASDLLKSDHLFMNYLWTSTHQAVYFVREHGYHTGVGDLDKKELLNKIKLIARASLHYFMVEKNNSENVTYCNQAVEVFNLCLNYINDWRRNDFDEFISFTCGDGDDNESEDIISTQQKKKIDTKELSFTLVQRVQRVVIGLVQDNMQSAGYRKMVTACAALLDTVCRVTLEQHPKINEDVFEWWLKVCQIKIDDTNCGKHIMTSLLDTASSTTSIIETTSQYEDVLTSLCMHYHSVAGSVDSIPDEDSEEKSGPYEIINSSNGDQLVVIVAKYVERFFLDLDWMVQQVRGQYSGTCDKNHTRLLSTSNLHGKLRKTEEEMSIKCMKVSRGLLHLCSSSAKEPATIDCILQTITSAFKFYNNFTKFFSWKFSQGFSSTYDGGVPVKFKKLIRFIGAELKPPLYDFIIHADSNQTERLENTRQNKKKDSKSFASGKAKVLREGKFLSQLIYSIEQHEHTLISLGRKLKIDLMKGHHLPTSRDFRIRNDLLQNALAEQSDESCSPSLKKQKIDEE